jgi:hypothetical protein
VDLNPVAVVFDFVEPLVPGRREGFSGGELRLDEARHVCRASAVDRLRTYAGQATLNQGCNSQKTGTAVIVANSPYESHKSSGLRPPRRGVDGLAWRYPREAVPAPDTPECFRIAFSATARSPPRRAPTRTAAFQLLSEFRATLPNTRGSMSPWHAGR